MNEVAIDITRLLGRYLKSRFPTGVDRVSLEYIRYFSGHAHAIVRVLGRTLVFDTVDSQPLFSALLSSDFSLRTRVVLRLTQGYLRFKRVTNLNGIVLFNTGHSGLEKPGYPGHLAKLGVKPVFFVHDLIPITHPEYCRVGEREKHITRMKIALQLAKGVITNSRYTLDCLNDFAQQQALAMPNSIVALLAPANLPLSRDDRPMEEPFFVMLGTIEPRKNHWMILQVWRRLVEKLGAKTPKLVLIGQRGWECENVLDLLELCEVIQPHVLELSHCDDISLASYLQHAQALLFPSFVEGFGMPLAEALAQGVPAIVSDLAVFREIAADIPDYLDPLDANAWVNSITQYCETNSEARSMQLKRMEAFQVTTWPEHFQNVEALLEKLK